MSRCSDALERSSNEKLGLHVVSAPASAARAASIFVHSKLLLALMDHLGFDHNRKRIPGWILGLPLSRLKWFLEGYREGDGVHSGQLMDEGIRHAFVTVSTELKDDLDRRLCPLWPRSLGRALFDADQAKRPVIANIRSGACHALPRLAVERPRVGRWRQPATQRSCHRRPRVGEGHGGRGDSSHTARIRLLRPGIRKLLGRQRGHGEEYLRVEDAPARRPRDPDVPAPGAGEPLDDGVRRRQPDALLLLRERPDRGHDRAGGVRVPQPREHRQPG